MLLLHSISWPHTYNPPASASVGTYTIPASLPLQDLPNELLRHKFFITHTQASVALEPTNKLRMVK